MRITVGQSKIKDPTTKKERIVKYTDVPAKNGWVSDLNWLPIPYDLLHLKFTASNLIKSGWWTGTRFNGLRLKPQDVVEKWKRNQDHD